jgi:hypothetical protein
MNCNRSSLAEEISDRTTFLDESQLLIFGGRQGRNDHVNSCALQQINVIWKPILPSWRGYYRKPNPLSFYPVRIHKRSSHKLAVLLLQQPLMPRFSRSPSAEPLWIITAVTRRFGLTARDFIACTRRLSATPFHELVKGLEIRARFAVSKELRRLQS